VEEGAEPSWVGVWLAGACHRRGWRPRPTTSPMLCPRTLDAYDACTANKYRTQCV